MANLFPSPGGATVEDRVEFILNDRSHLRCFSVSNLKKFVIKLLDEFFVENHSKCPKAVLVLSTTKKTNTPFIVDFNGL